MAALFATAAASMSLLESTDRAHHAGKTQNRRFLGYAILGPAISWATVSGVRERFGVDALALIAGGLLGATLDWAWHRKNGARIG